LDEAVLLGLRAVSSDIDKSVIERLIKTDGEAFDVIGLATSGAYFMSPTVPPSSRESLTNDAWTRQEFETRIVCDRAAPFFVTRAIERLSHNLWPTFSAGFAMTT
jgi:hypothetical protein